MKRFLVIMVSILLVMSLAGCSKKSTPAQSGSSSAPAKQNLRYIVGSGHTARALEYMLALEEGFMVDVQKRVADTTNYQIEWVPAFGTVANQADALKAIQNGLIDIGIINFSPLAGQLPIFSFSMILPFTTSNPSIAQKASLKIFDEFPILKEKLSKDFNQTFLALHGLADYGIYSTFSIATLADIRNKKIGGSGRNLLWLENTGAVPVSSNLGDGYTSLQTKLIDGQFCAATWGLGYKFPEVAPFYTKAGLGCAPTICLTANNDTWKSMPEEVKKIIIVAVEEWGNKSTQMSIDMEEGSIETFKKGGGTVVVMTDKAKQDWCAAVPNLPDVAARELGREGLIILKRYMEILKEMGEPVAREWTYPIN